MDHGPIPQSPMLNKTKRFEYTRQGMDWRIGSFTNTQELEPDLVLTLFPKSFPVQWSLCSAIADFCSEYFSSLKTSKEVRSAINYVLNELVENAVKFSFGETITVSLSMDKTELVLLVSNHIGEKTVEALKAKLQEILCRDPIEMLMERIRENAENPSAEESGLGFLTMITDYEAKLGWRLFCLEGNNDPPLLSTMARLEISS